jgi:hypothetical protein
MNGLPPQPDLLVAGRLNGDRNRAISWVQEAQLFVCAGQAIAGNQLTLWQP